MFEGDLHVLAAEDEPGKYTGLVDSPANTSTLDQALRWGRLPFREKIRIDWMLHTPEEYISACDKYCSACARLESKIELLS